MKRATAVLLVLAGLCTGAAHPAAAAGAAAGRFIAVAGDVKVLGPDGTARIAVRNGDIRQGESIVTGPNSLAQFRMSDGGAVSVRAETQMKLDAYRFSGRNDRGDSFLVSLLRGGFRTITGLIARNNRDNYRIQTSAMTIGVRGTDFEVVHVVQPQADAAVGTYNRVYFGVTTMQNRAGAVVLVNRDQTGFVPLAGNLPPVLVVPPAGLFNKPTLVPPASPQFRHDGKAQGGGGKPPARAIRDLPAVQEIAPAGAAAPAKTMAAPLLNPIDSPTLQTAPATTTISPTLISPITTTISPTTTTISPTTTTISPTTTTISPTLISPTMTTISPTTTTISPILTAPTTTTISPTTTTISPILTAPTTTISPTTTTIIKR